MITDSGTRELIDKEAKKYFLWVVTGVSIVMVLAALGTMIAGIASENMTFGMLGITFAGIVLNALLVKWLSVKFSDRAWTKWIMMLALTVLLVLMRLTTEDAPETHALGYFMIA
ncbi:MAG: hypothetical protein HGA22_06585, partial [Clostridiales bacterium]|nr:hypothetical protein [Clostridiales bacterium]